jgi:predicted TIM-barrel fold metal-dependent hydrolase
MQVVDADAHVEECEATWDYLDAALRPERPLPIALPMGVAGYGDWNGVWLINGEVFPKRAGRGWHTFGTPPLMNIARNKPASIGAQTLTDVPARLADMDATGIATQVILPTLFLVALPDPPRLERALCESYNRFMSQACAQGNGRLYFVAVAPWRDPAAALEVVRGAHELGAVAVMTSGLVGDRPLGDPAFEPVYAELERRGLPLVVHFAWGSPDLNNLFTEPTSSFCSAALPVVMGFYDLMIKGIYERYPRLKVAFLEAGCEWLPFVLRRLDTRFAGGQLPALSRAPSAYLRDGNVYLACESDEDIPHVLDFIGEDQLVMASDYPHIDDTSEADMAASLAERGDLSAALREKILSANPRRLYNLPA